MLLRISTRTPGQEEVHATLSVSFCPESEGASLVIRSGSPRAVSSQSNISDISATVGTPIAFAASAKACGSLVGGFVKTLKCRNTAQEAEQGDNRNMGDASHLSFPLKNSGPGI